MLEKGKMQVSIYQIDLMPFHEPTFENVVEKILNGINANEEIYTEEPVLNEDKIRFSLYLCYAQKIYPPKWRSFLKAIISKDSILHERPNITNSFILFVGYNNRIFAITGGTGSSSIEPFVSQTFGIEILTRLIKKDSKVIKSIQDRGVTGVILGQSKFFRGDQRLSDENQFGKIYKSVKAELDIKILKTIFGFKTSDLKRGVAGCLAKTSFQINKTIDFPTMLRVITKLSEVMEKDSNFSINNVHLISKRNIQNASLIKNLNDARNKILYDNYIQNIPSDFDFLHREFETYLTAQEYTVHIHGEIDPISFPSPPTFNNIIREIKRKARLLCANEIEFKLSVLDQIVRTFDGDGKLLTKGSVISHLHGEINHEGKVYFYIDNEWYEIKADFVKSLNLECRELLAQVLDNTLITEPFDLQTDEKIYNSNFMGKLNTIIFDTITPDNIESCDILIFKEGKIYLIHVKKGFNNSIRELTSQITLSAKRIKEDMKSGYNYINELESRTKNGKNSISEFNRKLSKQLFPLNGLKGIFETTLERNIHFCLAFVDTAKTNRCLKNDLHKFNSNIAKYCLTDTKREINSMGFSFQIIQLNRQ